MLGLSPRKMHQTYTVPAESAGERADKVLAGAFPEHSRTAFQRAFDAGRVTVRGSSIKRGHHVAAGEEIRFSFPDVEPAAMRPMDIPLAVLQEDRHLIAIDKPSGMIVHPGAGTGGDTLVHALLAHCRGNLSGIGGVERPGIVHRLDRETSGVIVAAKTDRAHRGIAEQFAGRTVRKEYLALVSGVPELMSGSVRKPIGRHVRLRHKMAVVDAEDGGRDAWTDWEVVERFGDLAALVRCTIHTGRTHQIRVHLKSLGHVVLGDAIYGWKPDARFPVRPERVLLHAEHLVLRHPIGGKKLDLRAALPADFLKAIKALRAAARKGANSNRSGARSTKRER